MANAVIIRTNSSCSRASSLANVFFEILIYFTCYLTNATILTQLETEVLSATFSLPRLRTGQLDVYTSYSLFQLISADYVNPNFMFLIFGYFRYISGIQFILAIHES